MAMPLPRDAKLWRARIKTELDRGTPPKVALQSLRSMFANYLREQDARKSGSHPPHLAAPPITPDIKAVIRRLK